MNTYMIFAAVFAFVMAWRQARHLDLLGMCGFLVIVGTMVIPLSSGRYSPDLLNVSIFVGLFLAFIVPIRVYYVGWKRGKAS